MTSQISDNFKTQEMCDALAREDPYTLEYIPNHLKTQEMCIEAVRTETFSFFDVQIIL